VVVQHKQLLLLAALPPRHCSGQEGMRAHHQHMWDAPVYRCNTATSMESMQRAAEMSRSSTSFQTGVSDRSERG
jgi:hypothetical protein